MKKIAILMMLVALSINSYSQTLTELDKKNGLSHFKFGTSSSSYHNQIKKDDSYVGDGLGEVYKVVDPSLTKVFDYYTETIALFFKENKLYAIAIDFTCETENHNYDLIKSYLIKLFGNPGIGDIERAEEDTHIVLKGKRWTGNYNELDIMDVYRKRTSCYRVQIWYHSKSVQKESLNKQF